ncbi:hypothetical protein [Synergistes jonesii]|uniref:hypothetical protein n=1 Tax=Synergistes jonesii TaxID=2754 RepID=UPI00248E42BF|nr:hypothetical protein [Synergistes jonesii]
MAVEFKIAGLDYRSATVGVREKFSFTESGRRELLREIAPRVREAVLISTCNRTELVVVSEEEPAGLLQRARGGGNFFSLSGEAVVERVFEIAAGLHSQIPLEDQILGQMKEALLLARQEKVCGALLGQLFQRAVAAGKEIRTKFKALPHEASAAAVACAEASAFYKSLKGVRALVVGSGEMGMAAAKLLVERGAEVRMTQRRRRKDGVRPPAGAALIAYDARYEALRECSLVICATASPHCVLAAEDFSDDGAKRLMIDLAVPRDIDPAFAERPSVTLVDMDGLGCKALPEGFMREIRKSFEANIKRFHEWLDVHECVPYIENICSFAEREMVEGLGCESEEERLRVKEASRAMMNKLLFSMKKGVDMDMAKECYRALSKGVRA